ncbi:PREDICTED: ATP-dependent DNA helicase PIF1 [Ceratosolen solmsi marchali]|uniref:ATP-dependent DNA helicase PIF1 n=1 Tax=Ceratosolen solmsi marchali TaxID=326594 RepID=A0AAJ7DXE1_9HYME|nr:PREDICTED: ATP-dependent DNA helicase PIF1 [Ceratosolen solmsi marchali]
MNGDGCYLTCGVVMEWTNSQGSIVRKVNHRTATCRIIRNSLQQLLIEVGTEKSNSNVKFHLQDISLFNRFMGEGKATIKFKLEKCTLYLSNAPAGQLINFLKMIFIKMHGKDDDKPFINSIKEKLLGNQGTYAEDISPASIAEIKRAKEKAVSRSTITTPSPSNVRKRKLNAENTASLSAKIPKAKKLFNNPTLQETTEEQSRILQCVLSGKNIFFTGSAGTGKSFLLKKIVSALPPDVTMVTASTGVAACHIGGITLHQFAGIGLGMGTMERCKQIVSKSVAGTNWRKIKHLIIDEISMVDGDYFDKIEAVARFVRNSEKPFGGIQLILCGDFFQLPPVSKRDEKVKFCFQSQAWNKCIHINFELRTVHRQTDQKFINILNKVRVGQVTDEISEVLKSTSKQKIEIGGILATRLCSHINEANEINETQLNKLSGISKVYMAQNSDESMMKILDQQLSVPNKLILKVGAQVMLLKNLNVNKGLVNGARGVVVQFEDDIPVVHFRTSSNYKVKMEKWSIKVAGGAIVYRKQIPLKLAWAFSIHKSQGLTLDCVEMSLARVFDAGQAYVALSRAQSLQTLRVLDFSAQQVWANKEVLNFYKKFQKQIELTKIIPLGKKLNFV